MVHSLLYLCSVEGGALTLQHRLNSITAWKKVWTMSVSLSNRVCDNLRIDETSVHTIILHRQPYTFRCARRWYMHPEGMMVSVLYSLFYSQGRSLVWKESATRISIRYVRSPHLRMSAKIIKKNHICKDFVFFLIAPPPYSRPTPQPLPCREGSR